LTKNQSSSYDIILHHKYNVLSTTMYIQSDFFKLHVQYWMLYVIYKWQHFINTQFVINYNKVYKRNETERNETKSNETKRNRSKRNETKSNETKRNDVTFRFVRFRSFCLISFRFVSFGFVSFLFRFALYRYPISYHINIILLNRREHMWFFLI
jgi:nitrate reductase NapE component